MKKTISAPTAITKSPTSQFNHTLEIAAQSIRATLNLQEADPFSRHTIAQILNHIPDNVVETLVAACPYENTAKDEKRIYISHNATTNNQLLHDLELSLNQNRVTNNSAVTNKLFLNNGQKAANPEEIQRLLSSIVHLNSNQPGKSEAPLNTLNYALTQILRLKGKTGIQDMNAHSICPSIKKPDSGESIVPVMLGLPRIVEILTRHPNQAKTAILHTLEQTGTQKKFLIKLFLVASLRELYSNRLRTDSTVVMSTIRQTRDTPQGTHDALTTEESKMDLAPANKLSELKLKAQNTTENMALQPLADTLKPLIEAFNTSNQPFFGKHPLQNDLKKMGTLYPALFEIPSPELARLNTPKQRKALLNQLLTETNHRHSTGNLTTSKRDRALAKVIVAFLVQERQKTAEAFKPLIREAINELNLIKEDGTITLSIQANEAATLLSLVSGPSANRNPGFLMQEIYQLPIPAHKYGTLAQEIGHEHRPIQYNFQSSSRSMRLHAGNTVIRTKILDVLGVDKNNVFHQETVATVINEYIPPQRSKKP